VIVDREAPLAYFPHQQGLPISAVAELLAEFARDPRIRLIEITEYSGLRDLERRGLSRLSDLIGKALSQR